VIEFILENLLLLPFLFITYVVLEWIEARAGDTLERKLGRVRRWGPLAGALTGIVPQCGFSAAAASFYAGGVISAGTLIAVFLSTSDELIPVLVNHADVIPPAVLAKIVLLKALGGVVAGCAVNAVLRIRGGRPPVPHVDELCAHSHCSCAQRKGVFLPALIHTLEIFFFILVVSGAVRLALSFCGGEEALKGFILNRPIAGELLAGLLGLIPNCAPSVVFADLFVQNCMSPGALMAGSLCGSGVGLLVLFRTNRDLRANLGILATVYVSGVTLGALFGLLF